MGSVSVPGSRAELDPAGFRSVLGRFATGVVAVTGLTGGGPAGLAVNSFTSVSLTPPLVCFCVAHNGRTWPRLRGAPRICVNILGEDQRAVAGALGRSGPDKFREVPWSASPSGAPVLDGAIAWLECSVTAEHPAGDHDIVVSRVHHLGGVSPAGPLVFYGGRYGRFVAAGAEAHAIGYEDVNASRTDCRR